MKKIETRIRFSDSPWMKNLPTVTIGGLGGIGSWVTFFIGRFGGSMTLYDFDTVDDSNLGGQCYGRSYLGKTKEAAMVAILDEFCDNRDVFTFGKLEEDSMVSEYCFACFDSMSARKSMFEAWKKLENRKLFIDGRMLAEAYQIYVVTPGQEEEYEKTLFEDDEVEDLLCSYKATTHCGAGIAHDMTVIFTNFLTNLEEDIRVVPKRINNLLPLMHKDVY